MQMIIIETMKLVIALVLLAIIAKLSETKPVCDPFFADQKWTLAEAYKVLVSLLALLIPSFILSRLYSDLHFDTRLILQLVTSSAWCIAISGLFWFFVKVPYNVNASTFGLQKAKFLSNAVVPANIVTFFFLSSILGEKSSPQLSPYVYTIKEISFGLVLLVVAVFVSSALEELLFRGILYPPVMRRIGKWQAIIYLSLTESLLHVQGNIGDTFGRFLTSLLLYFVYGRSKSLYGPIIFHIGFNAIAWQPRIKNLLAVHIDSKTLDHYSVWSILFLAFCINLSWFMRRKRNPGQSSSILLGPTLRDERTHNDVSKGS
jgi:membrane protease YdiL (CAAX protease family)